MKKYLWRKSFTAFYTNQTIKIKGKLAFKTQATHWLNTESPVLVLISIHSAFHEGIWGQLKMNALLSVIKESVRGKITVLLADKAHVNVMNIKQPNSLDLSIQHAYNLNDQFRSYFDGCNVAYWHHYICQDKNYPSNYEKVLKLSQNDSVFQKLLKADAKETFTTKRAAEISDPSLFILRAIEDLLEQCACLLVLSDKGYRFMLYPGNPFTSTEYVNKTLLAKEQQIAFVPIFLTIEKKVILSMSPQESAKN